VCVCVCVCVASTAKNHVCVCVCACVYVCVRECIKQSALMRSSHSSQGATSQHSYGLVTYV
jgi:hypothetical protein